MHVFPPCFNAGDTIYFPFDSYDSNGASVTITGLAVTDIEVYKDGSTTARSSDNGYALLDTDGIDFNSTTGLHGFSIDTSNNSDAGFWADGSQYWVNVNAVTIDSQTVRFTYFLPLGFSLRPTTAGRKLDVSSGGEAGIDWANIGSPTTTVNLSGTTVKTATDVETDTADIQSRIPTALGANGNMKADVRDYNGVAGTFGLGLPSVNPTYWNGTAISSEIPTMLISSGTGAGQLNVTSGVIDSNLVQMVGVAQSVTDLKDFADAGYDPDTNKVQGVVLVDTTTTNTDMRGTDSAYTGTPPTAAAIADAVWEEPIADHENTAGSTAEQLSAAGSAGDPWATEVPGAYASGTAGYKFGNIPTVSAIVDGLGGRTIVIQSPLDGNKVTLYANAEYTTGSQRLTVTNSTGGGWPNGATYTELKFVVRTNGTETAYGTGAWVVTSGAGAQVAFSFTSEEMAALLATAPQENATCGVWAYQSGDESTRFPLLAEGKLRLVDVPWVSS